MTILEEAETALRQGKLRESRRLFLLALEAGEAPSRCNDGLGTASYQLRSYDEADVYAHAALKADPSLHGSHMVLAYLHARRGDLSASLQEAATAEQLAPLSAEIPAFRGGVFLSLGRVEEARGALEQAADLGADDWIFHNNIGELRLREGRLSDATNAYVRASRLHPAARTLLPLLSLLALKYRLPLAILYGGASVVVLGLHSLALLVVTAVPLITLGVLEAVRGRRGGAVMALMGVLYILAFYFTG